MLISLIRTAYQALTFNVDPALLPRWERGPLLIALAAALVSSSVRIAPVGSLIVISLVVLLAGLPILSKAGLAPSVPRETVALIYLMCVGVLIFNVPAAVIAGLGLVYGCQTSSVLGASNNAGDGDFRSMSRLSASLGELPKDLGGLCDLQAFASDSSAMAGHIALAFILLSLVSARPRIRRAFFRDDVCTARKLLLDAAVRQSAGPAPSAPLNFDETGPSSPRGRSTCDN